MRERERKKNLDTKVVNTTYHNDHCVNFSRYGNEWRKSPYSLAAAVLSSGLTTFTRRISGYRYKAQNAHYAKDMQFESASNAELFRCLGSGAFFFMLKIMVDKFFPGCSAAVSVNVKSYRKTKKEKKNEIRAQVCCSSKIFIKKFQDFSRTALPIILSIK